MGMYAIAIRPLIDILSQKITLLNVNKFGMGMISLALEIRKQWDNLNESGPSFDYFPKPSKIVLIIKNPDEYQKTEEIFQRTGIKITRSGERHLGAVIWSEADRDDNMPNKVKTLFKDVEQLAKMAVNESHLVYSSYTKAMCI